MNTTNRTVLSALDHSHPSRPPLGSRLLISMFRNLSLTALLATVACDDPGDFGPLADEADVEDVEDVEDDTALDALTELATQKRWDDGLEEFLDISCDDGACPWVWTDAIDGLAQALPQLPEANGVGARTLTAARDPAAAGAKTVEVTHVHCYETQDVGKDEPYLLMNGGEVWSLEGVKNGSSYNVGETATTKVRIELWERDLSVDDKIGDFTVQSTKPNGNHSALLTGKGGEYRVYYTVHTS